MDTTKMNEKESKLIDDIISVALQVDPDINTEFPEYSGLSIIELKTELGVWKDKLKEKRATDRLVKKQSQNVRDFLVKLQRLFKEDCYIYNSQFIIPGEKSKEDLKGEFVLEVSDDFTTEVVNICRKNPDGLIYIEDIDLIKKMIDDNTDVDPADRIRDGIRLVHRDSEEFSSVRNHIMKTLDGIHDDVDLFITIPPQVDEEIYTIKKIFRLQYDGCKPVELNLELIPTASEDSLSEVEYCCREDADHKGSIPLYYLRLKIPFTHFMIFAKYYYF